MNPTNSIIFQTHEGPETDFEFEYINDVVLKNIPDKKIFFDDFNCKEIDNNSLVVYSSNKVKPDGIFLDYLQKLKTPVLLHLSNESQNHLGGYYKKAKAVLRSLSWNPFTKYSNVFTVPLGFQSGYLNKNPEKLTFNNRNLIWAFAGAIKFDRMEMLSALESITPHWYFKAADWKSKDVKSTSELIEIYKNTIFAPSPFGNINFECFRTMEALEWGCIPVVTKFLGRDCYKYIYGDHPLIVGENWTDAAKQMSVLLSNPVALKAKQEEVASWYQNFKKQLAKDVVSIVNGDFDNLVGNQFKYQYQSTKDNTLKWRFFKHFTLNVYWKRLIGKALPSKIK